MTNIKDVAEAAGVSTATVSRVMAEKPHVRPDIRARVMAAAERLNYRPNRVARSLRVQQSNTIGLIVADIRNPFFTSVSRAVEDIAYSQGCTLFLCNTDEDPQKEEMYLNLLRDENAAGVILAPTRETADAFAERVRLDVPIVVIDRRVRGAEVDSVLIDNVDAAHKLADHLIRDGYRRVSAFFGIGSTTGRERKEGFLRAFEEHGIALPPELLLMVDAKIEPGYEAALKLLDLPEPPDALMSSNGLLAAGVFRAIQERQPRFAKPIGFASFDETNWTTLVRPPVTVIEQPTYEIGQTATELLLRRIEEPSRPAREVILKTRMIIRQSCGCR